MTIRQRLIRTGARAGTELVGRGARVLLIGLVTACTWSAQGETSAEADPAEVQRAATEDPMVCKRMVPTGSRIQRRYCLKQSQWDAMREGGQRAANDAIVEESQFGYRGMGPGGTNPY